MDAGTAAGGWAHFSGAELACRCCGVVRMDPGFMTRLEHLRNDFARGMPLSSGYRCPKHDAAIGGAGAHPTGHAVDVRIFGTDVYRLVGLAIRHGMTGVGIKQHGDMQTRFVHLDDLADGAHPRPRVWTY